MCIFHGAKKMPLLRLQQLRFIKYPEQDYLDCLIADLQIEAESVQARELISIFIGGGTPSLFSAKSLAILLQAVAKKFHFNKDIEVTLEVNPASADKEKFPIFSTQALIGSPLESRVSTTQAWVILDASIPV